MQINGEISSGGREALLYREQERVLHYLEESTSKLMETANVMHQRVAEERCAMFQKSIRIFREKKESVADRALDEQNLLS